MLSAIESNQLAERLSWGYSLIYKEWARWGGLIPTSGFPISDLRILKSDSFSSYLISTHGVSGTAAHLVRPAFKGSVVKGTVSPCANIFLLNASFDQGLYWVMVIYQHINRLSAHNGRSLHSSSFLKKWSIVDLQYCVSFRYTVRWFSYTYIFFFRFFPLMGYYKILSIAPWAIQ